MAAKKTYSKAARRKARKEFAELAEVPKKQPNGRKRRPTGHVAEKNPAKTVLEARARQMGATGNLEDMRNPDMETPAGLAIHSVHRGEVAKNLCDAYSALSVAYKRYLSICIGASVDAKTAKIEMMPERFETSASDNIDMRSEEERHRAADVAWDRWKNMIGHLSLAHSSAIYSALHGWGGMMDAGAITDQGRRFVWAMEALAEVVDRAGATQEKRK